MFVVNLIFFKKIKQKSKLRNFKVDNSLIFETKLSLLGCEECKSF